MRTFNDFFYNVFTTLRLVLSNKESGGKASNALRDARTTDLNMIHQNYITNTVMKIG